MKKIALVYILLNFTCISYSQTYVIPNAEVQPTWVFPLCFEDATGARDTIYIAYDPDAINFDVPSADTIFGEAFLPADTSKFMVYWDEIYDDQVIKTVVWKNLYPANINFNKAQLPVKFTWDTQLFYSDNLPFPNNDPLPNAWGLVHCGAWKEFDGCQFDEYSGIYLTDAPDGIYTSEAVDSILYASDYFEFFENGLDFRILQYGDDYNWMSVAENEVTNIGIYPNPVSDVVQIRFAKYKSAQLIITDVSGKVIKRVDNFTGQEFDVHNLLPGIYFIYVHEDAVAFSGKFIKM
jgi:hypothetical protein